MPIAPNAGLLKVKAIADNMRGKFITLEGGDGSGKSTTAAWLKGELKDRNILFTREPGGTESAEEIRHILIKKRDKDLDVLTQILLFEAGRREHVTKIIIPALEAGRHVVCERFSASTYGYQIIAGEGARYEELYLAIDEEARRRIEPDLIIFLDVEPEVGLTRKRLLGGEPDTFEEKEVLFHANVRKGIRAYVRDRVHVTIDSTNAGAEKVREEVKRAILELVNHGPR